MQSALLSKLENFGYKLKTKPNWTNRLDQAITLLKQAHAVISDIDGVVVIDGEISHRTASFFKDRLFAFVTNGSRQLPCDMASFFKQCGIDATEQHFFMAGHQTVIEMAKHFPHAAVAVSASDRIKDFANDCQLKVLERQNWNNAEAVLLCCDPLLNFDDFETLLNLAFRGIPFICSNPDLTYPGNNRLYAETGCVLTALQRAVPNMNLTVIGKPQKTLLESALEHIGVPNHQAVMLGDNPSTDGLCAAALNVPFICVGGKYGIEPELFFINATKLRQNQFPERSRLRSTDSTIKNFPNESPEDYD